MIACLKKSVFLIKMPGDFPRRLEVAYSATKCFITRLELSINHESSVSFIHALYLLLIQLLEVIREASGFNASYRQTNWLDKMGKS